MGDCVCARVSVCVCVYESVCVCVLLFSTLHVTTLLKALAYIILWFNYDIVDVLNVVTFYFINVSDATNKFLPKDMNFKEGLPC